MIQSVYLPTFMRLYIFISFAIAGYVGVVIVAGTVATIIVLLPERIVLEIIDLLEFTVQAGLLSNVVKHFVLILKSFKLLLPIILGPFVLFHSLVPTDYGPPPVPS